MSRNSDPLMSFVAYCQQHPNERFWQALRNWAGFAFIYASNRPWQNQDLHDTFYWEDREGKGIIS